MRERIYKTMVQKYTSEIEDALFKDFSYAAIDNVRISSKGLNSDIHASADYRAHIIKVMAKKAISNC